MARSQGGCSSGSHGAISMANVPSARLPAPAATRTSLHASRAPSEPQRKRDRGARESETCCAHPSATTFQLGPRSSAGVSAASSSCRATRRRHRRRQVTPRSWRTPQRIFALPAHLERVSGCHPPPVALQQWELRAWCRPSPVGGGSHGESLARGLQLISRRAAFSHSVDFWQRIKLADA